MMKKKIKKTGIILGILVCMQMTAVNAMAQAQTTETLPTWEKFAPKNMSYVEDTYRPLIKGSLMYHGYVKLQDLDGDAGIYGETLASRDADEVGLNIYLDKYNGTNYGTYTYWKTTEYNTSMNIKSYAIWVPQGYYYRIHGYHYVEDGSDFENGSTLTQGLMIPQ